MSYRKEVISALVASIFIFLCSLPDQTNATIGVFQAEVDPLRQGCAFKDEFFMFGISPTQGFCGQVDCDENCHCFMYSCDYEEAEPPCYLIQGRSQFYPDCCPRAVCPVSTDENLL